MLNMKNNYTRKWSEILMFWYIFLSNYYYIISDWFISCQSGIKIRSYFWTATCSTISKHLSAFKFTIGLQYYVTCDIVCFRFHWKRHLWQIVTCRKSILKQTQPPQMTTIAMMSITNLFLTIRYGVGHKWRHGIKGRLKSCGSPRLTSLPGPLYV